MSADELQQRNKLHKLSQFPAGTIFELIADKRINTVNGEALLVEFSTEVGEKKMEGKLIVPNRVIGEVEGKTPLIMVYAGKSVSKANKEFHDLSFIEVERSAGIPKASKKTKAASELPPLHLLEDALASFSDAADDDEEEWVPPKCSKKDECNKGINICYGYCLKCHEHMPYNGSQCRCYKK